jgi:hypothetical protein
MIGFCSDTCYVWHFARAMLVNLHHHHAVLNAARAQSPAGSAERWRTSASRTASPVEMETEAADIKDLQQQQQTTAEQQTGANFHAQIVQQHSYQERKSALPDSESETRHSPQCEVKAEKSPLTTVEVLICVRPRKHSTFCLSIATLDVERHVMGVATVIDACERFLYLRKLLAYYAPCKSLEMCLDDKRLPHDTRQIIENIVQEMNAERSMRTVGNSQHRGVSCAQLLALFAAKEEVRSSIDRLLIGGVRGSHQIWVTHIAPEPESGDICLACLLWLLKHKQLTRYAPDKKYTLRFAQCGTFMTIDKCARRALNLLREDKREFKHNRKAELLLADPSARLFLVFSSLCLVRFSSRVC